MKLIIVRKVEKIGNKEGQVRTTYQPKEKKLARAFGRVLHRVGMKETASVMQ